MMQLRDWTLRQGKSLGSHRKDCFKSVCPVKTPNPAHRLSTDLPAFPRRTSGQKGEAEREAGAASAKGPVTHILQWELGNSSQTLPHSRHTYGMADGVASGHKAEKRKKKKKNRAQYKYMKNFVFTVSKQQFQISEVSLPTQPRWR